MLAISPVLPLLFSLTASDSAMSSGGGSPQASYRQVLITEHGGPEVLRLVESTPLPEPGPGEVRLRVLTASASFTDVMVRKGLYQGVSADPPYPPGYDLVGVVDALGDGVEHLQIGQRVADLTVWGAYTEFAIRPAEGVVPVPDGLPSDEAVVLVLSYLTAYQMLHRVAEVEAGQTVLIHGASGAVGTALAQLGKVAGLTMYGTASTGKQEYIRELGVIPIDYRTEDFVERVMADTEGGGVDVVFDAIGVNNFKRSYSVLAPAGLLVKYGLYRASLEETSMWAMGWEFLRIVGQQKMWEWFPEEDKRAAFYSIQDVREQHSDWFREDLSALFELALKENIDPHIWRHMPLEQAAEAHRLIEAGEVKGKIVLEVARER